MNNNKGVSLITIVITIIVIIILSAIALGNGALNITSRANFLHFSTEMADFAENFKQDFMFFQGRLQMMDYYPTDAQIYNFIARGLEKTTNQEDSAVYNSWLSMGHADDIPCTPIDRTYAKEYLDMKDRKVDTQLGNAQLVTYFVTPKGNIFCWPPYPHDDRSYVNGQTTAKSMSGDDLPSTSATDASKNPQVKITFLNGEEVIISNSAPSNNNLSKGSDILDPTRPSIWYSSETKGDSANVSKFGVAQGYTFDGYDRSL